MRSRITYLVVLVSLLVVSARAAWGDTPPWPGNPDAPAVVDGNNDFALGLYKRLAQQEDGDFLFSPYSISTALAMTYAGARGNTETQMAGVLHFTLPQEQLHPAFAEIIGNLNDSQRTGYQLSVANRLWGQEGYPFLPTFLNIPRDYYGAELAQVDFVRHTEQARQTINHWVEEQTQEKIRDLIPPGVLDEYTRLVLTNAIYFKSDWANQFAKELTVTAPFMATPGTELSVPTMHQLSRFDYAAFPTFQMLELPYADEELSMLALLPSEVDGLAGLEASLTSEMLGESIAQLQPRDVCVSLPKFEVTSEFKLSDLLASMGMAEAFVPGFADFSGMDGTRNLYISEVVHKGFVNVYEAGTEAAAATGVVVSLTSVPSDVVEFRADHPFLFLVRDNTTQSILFMGRVTSPSCSVAVPEPSTLAGLLSMAAVGLLALGTDRRLVGRRRRSA
jgi:serpin B